MVINRSDCGFAYSCPEFTHQPQLTFSHPDRGVKTNARLYFMRQGAQPVCTFTAEFCPLVIQTSWGDAALHVAFHEGLTSRVKDKTHGKGTAGQLGGFNPPPRCSPDHQSLPATWACLPDFTLRKFSVLTAHLWVWQTSIIALSGHGYSSVAASRCPHQTLQTTFYTPFCCLYHLSQSLLPSFFTRMPLQHQGNPLTMGFRPKTAPMGSETTLMQFLLN